MTELNKRKDSCYVSWCDKRRSSLQFVWMTVLSLTKSLKMSFAKDRSDCLTTEFTSWNQCLLWWHFLGSSNVQVLPFLGFVFWFANSPVLFELPFLKLLPFLIFKRRQSAEDFRHGFQGPVRNVKIKAKCGGTAGQIDATTGRFRGIQVSNSFRVNALASCNFLESKSWQLCGR